MNHGDICHKINRLTEKTQKHMTVKEALGLVEILSKTSNNNVIPSNNYVVVMPYHLKELA